MFYPQLVAGSIERPQNHIRTQIRYLVIGKMVAESFILSQKEDHLLVLEKSEDQLFTPD